MSDAYEEGKRAFENGKKMTENPHYPSKAKEREDAWREGWQDALKEASENRKKSR